MNFGNLFHNVSVEYMKDRAAKVWYLTFGVCSMVSVSLDCTLPCLFLFMLIRPCKYFGAMPVMHLNVVIRILCSILCWIGSQCSFFSTHDELKYLFLFRISLAQLFCMVWYFFSVFDGRPSVLVWYKIELLDIYILWRHIARCEHLMLDH